MPGRGYEQLCPIARWHDLLGDRWTLLVIRELWPGPRRFTDLQVELVGISPTLLTRRLRMLTDAGLITRAAGLEPGAGTSYLLTDAGRSLEPLLITTARWGWRLMSGEPGDAHRPRLLLPLTVASLFRADAVLSRELHEWRDDRITFRVIADSSGISMFTDDAGAPTAVMTVPEATLLAIAEGSMSLGNAVQNELIDVAPSYEVGSIAATYRGET